VCHVLYPSGCIAVQQHLHPTRQFLLYMTKVTAALAGVPSSHMCVWHGRIHVVQVSTRRSHKGRLRVKLSCGMCSSGYQGLPDRWSAVCCCTGPGPGQ